MAHLVEHASRIRIVDHELMAEHQMIPNYFTQGNATTSVLLHIYDGQPHPTTGNPLYDASAYLRLDANTVVYSRFKGGKLVQIGTIAVSQDGKSRTNTASGILGPNGLAGTTVSFYDKQ
jgi:hypothetical protein